MIIIIYSLSWGSFKNIGFLIYLNRFFNQFFFFFFLMYKTIGNEFKRWMIKITKIFINPKCLKCLKLKNKLIWILIKLKMSSNFSLHKYSYFYKVMKKWNFLRICSHLLKKTLVENFIFCVVLLVISSDILCVGQNMISVSKYRF